MDDLAEMRAGSRKTASACSVCRLIETMDPEHREVLRAGLADPTINTTGILAWLEKRGYSIGLRAPEKALLYHQKNHG